VELGTAAVGWMSRHLMNNIGQGSMGVYLLLHCLFLLFNAHLSRGKTWYGGDKTGSE